MQVRVTVLPTNPAAHDTVHVCPTAFNPQVPVKGEANVRAGHPTATLPTNAKCEFAALSGNGKLSGRGSEIDGTIKIEWFSYENV